MNHPPLNHLELDQLDPLERIAIALERIAGRLDALHGDYQVVEQLGPLTTVLVGGDDQ